jgi:CBS domain-containing protein
MKISDIMIKQVITVNSDYTVKHAASIMNRAGIGCLIVLDNKEIVGILTERDILKRVVAIAKDPEKTFVREVMSTPVFVVESDISLEDAIELMFRHKIKKLPVAEKREGKDELIGLVTLTDIARMQSGLIKELMQYFKEEEETPPKSMEKVMNYYIV